ncbi:MAG TPA: DUF2461 domain-containing protein [Puia sp.]|nr:DUF2461 domain-containing protein [Puia sp.]
MLKTSTLKFLKDLKKNNNKTWFEKNKLVYLDARDDAEQFVAQLIEGLGKADPDVKSLQAKDCTYRIYRDIRFSSDKTPYKVHMGAFLNKGGKKAPTAGYYFHIQPGGKSMAGGGLWMPMPPELNKVRQEIDYNFSEWAKITNDRKFKKHFPEGLDREEILSRPPKGYDPENPAIDFLKLKSFVVTRPLTDELLASRGLLKELLTIFGSMKPFVHFLNRSLE